MDTPCSCTSDLITHGSFLHSLCIWSPCFSLGPCIYSSFCLECFSLGFPCGWLTSFFKKIIYFNWRLITLQYCSGFSIHWHESAMGVHVFPILNPLPPPTPSQPTGSSQCTSPEHPVSCISVQMSLCQAGLPWTPIWKERTSYFLCHAQSLFQLYLSTYLSIHPPIYYLSIHSPIYYLSIQLSIF